MPKKKKSRPRDAVRTRAEILAVAFGEVFRHGFQGVSVNDIVAKARLTKGAFFHHFPTKNDLGYALVDETLREMVLDRWLRPLDAYDDPIVGIPDVLTKVIKASPPDSIGLGCPLNNLVQEMSTIDPVFRDKLHDVLELWVAGIEQHLRRAKLKKGVDPRRAAEFVVMSHEGAFGMSKSTRSRDVFTSLHASLQSYLQTLVSSPDA